MRSHGLSRTLEIGLALAALAALLASASSASTKPGSWRVVKLGTLGGRVAYASSADAINARGDVIGNSWNRSHTRTRAFLWRGGRLTPLGTLGGASSQANAINDRGQIVGWAETTSGKQHAFLWEDGRMRDLGVPRGNDSSEAFLITNSGLVVGRAYRDGTPITGLADHVLIWQNGRIRDLGKPWSPNRNAGTAIAALNERDEVVGSTGYEYLSANGRVFFDTAFLWDGRHLRTLPPRNARTEAVDINDSGRVIGWIYRGEFRAVAWENGQMRLLALPPGLKGAFTSAINSEGDVVGYAWGDRDVDDHAILWSKGTAVDLGTLGGAQSEAKAINNRGQVIGTSETALGDPESPDRHAFVWQDGQMLDLGSGYPTAINDRGQIIGATSSYEGRALVWLPNS